MALLARPLTSAGAAAWALCLRDTRNLPARVCDGADGGNEQLILLHYSEGRAAVSGCPCRRARYTVLVPRLCLGTHVWEALPPGRRPGEALRPRGRASPHCVPRQSLGTRRTRRKRACQPQTS